jgi:hypothetical protein
MSVCRIYLNLEANGVKQDCGNGVSGNIKFATIWILRGMSITSTGIPLSTCSWGRLPNGPIRLFIDLFGKACIQAIGDYRTRCKSLPVSERRRECASRIGSFADVELHAIDHAFFEMVRKAHPTICVLVFC